MKLMDGKQGWGWVMKVAIAQDVSSVPTRTDFFLKKFKHLEDPSLQEDCSDR